MAWDGEPPGPFPAAQTGCLGPSQGKPGWASGFFFGVTKYLNPVGNVSSRSLLPGNSLIKAFG